MLVALLDLTMTDLETRAAAARDEGRDPVERFALLVQALRCTKHTSGARLCGRQ